MDTCDEATRLLVEDLCSHIIGRKSGRSPSQNERKLIDGLRAFVSEGKVIGKKRQRIVSDCKRIVAAVAGTAFIGDPSADWISVRDIVAASSEGELQRLAKDSRYLRFLRKGTQLRMKLSALWQGGASYKGATDAVKNAFVQEHFAAKAREPRGVHVMTIHKSKGKEFDEVLVYEGIYSDRIVRQPDDEAVVAQARLSLRVAVSRARRRVTVLTSEQKPCELL